MGAKISRQTYSREPAVGRVAEALARNRYLASKRRSYTGEVAADLKKLVEQVKGDSALLKLLDIEKPDAAGERKLRADFERFCATFPDFFVMADRSTNSSTAELGKNRPLTAGLTGAVMLWGRWPWTG